LNSTNLAMSTSMATMHPSFHKRPLQVLSPDTPGHSASGSTDSSLEG
jgi:hypothetical protein